MINRLNFLELINEIEQSEKKELKFDFDDVLIVPAITTDINSRSTISCKYICETFHSQEHLPLIAAPMDTVVSKDNREDFIMNDINICYPRGVETKRWNINGKLCFVSYSLNEFTEIFIDKNFKIENDEQINICIDTANGHIDTLLNSIKIAKQIYGSKINLMAGNIANPYSYLKLSLAGCNYIRVGIGNGNGCLTTQQTAVGFPMGSLIRECYELKTKFNCEAKIVADGGMKKYSDIIKALALGADYVMIGSIFNKSLESCGDTYLFRILKLNPKWKITKWLFQNNFKLTKSFRGMSTKEVQRKWNKSIIKTSEGISTYRPVEYTISSWVENFQHYLKSSMSYTNHPDLVSFIGKVKFNLITNNSFLRFKK